MGKVMSTELIGDGKTPNHYWLTVSSNYYYTHKVDGEDYMDSITDIIKDPELNQSKTIATFDTYGAAKAFIASNISLGYEYQGIRVNTVMIEDRLSGQLYEQTYIFNPAVATLAEFTTEDFGFTLETMKAAGLKFS